MTPVEVLIGYDGIVLATAKSAPDFSVTLDQIVAALAKDVVVNGQVVPNPYVNWSDVDASLPAEKIEVMGPPPTSGTRDAFVELVMVAHCPAEVKAVAAEACSAIREDGAYIDAGENDNLIVQKLEANPAAVGIFGYSFLDQNTDALKGAAIDGVAPTFEAIASGEYPVARSLYFYIKKENIGVTPGIVEYAAEFMSRRRTRRRGLPHREGPDPADRRGTRSQHQDRRRPDRRRSRRLSLSDELAAPATAGAVLVALG